MQPESRPSRPDLSHRRGGRYDMIYNDETTTHNDTNITNAIISIIYNNNRNIIIIITIYIYIYTYKTYTHTYSY